MLTLPEGEEPQARPFPSRTNRVLPRTLNAENEDALRVHANLKSRLEAASAANTGLTSTSFTAAGRSTAAQQRQDRAG